MRSRVSGGRPMSKKKPNCATCLRQLKMALSRWDDEGGAGPSGPQGGSVSAEAQSDIPQLTNADLVQLSIRVIALEKLAIGLLAEASERQLGLAREMAAYFSPSTGLAHRPCTRPPAGQLT